MQEIAPISVVVTLPETISAINIADATEDYKLMYVDYRDTGVFKRDLLKKVGDIDRDALSCTAETLRFQPEFKGRFSVFGLRLLQTKEANIRMFFQIWDSSNGTIAWEGTEEMSYSWDTGSEKPVTFRTIVEKTAQNLISHLP